MKAGENFTAIIGILNYIAAVITGFLDLGKLPTPWIIPIGFFIVGSLFLTFTFILHALGEIRDALTAPPEYYEEDNYGEVQ